METVDKIVMLPIDNIKPYENNPRQNSRTVDLLVEILPKVGFNVPLVLDKDNVIVKGHARYLAAKKLGMTELPCVYTNADAEAIKADRIADNKVFEFTQWLNEDLMHELDMIDFDFDPSMFGLPDMGAMTDLPAFEFDDDEPEMEMSDEERKAKYQALMEQLEAESEPVVITSETAIKSAKAEQKNEAKAPPEYFTVKCEKCGKILYVRKGDDMIWQ